MLQTQPVLYPQCGPQHYITVFVCWAACMCTLFIDSLHTLGMSANGEAALFITHLTPKMDIFFAFTPFIRPQKPIF